MSFTREAVFLKWGAGGSTKYAFKVKQVDYSGARHTKPATYGRALSSGNLLAVYTPLNPRIWLGQVWGLDSASGTANDGTEDISYGDIDDLKTAWAATDLQVKSFEDSNYWSCEWKGDWDTALEFDPLRNQAVITMMLEQKS